VTPGQPVLAVGVNPFAGLRPGGVGGEEAQLHPFHVHVEPDPDREPRKKTLMAPANQLLVSGGHQ